MHNDSMPIIPLKLEFGFIIPVITPVGRVK